MIVVDIECTDQRQYDALVRHMLKKCDKISFHFPGVDNRGEVIPQKNWQEYHEKNEPFVKTCLGYGATQSYHSRYQGMKLGYVSRVIYVKPFPLLEQLLLNNHLFMWTYQNDLPEDVCFHKGQKIRYFSCSHEDEFRIFNEDNEDLDFLRNSKFRYWIANE